MIITIILLSWTVACWFSGVRETPFLHFPLFSVNVLIPFVLTAISFLTQLTLLVIKKRQSIDFSAFLAQCRKHRRELLILAVILLAHLGLQIPYVVMDKGSNDWDSALYGLSGYHIAKGEARPVYSYARHHIGTLNPHLSAPLHLMFGFSPKHLRIINTAFYLAFLVLFYLLIRRYFDTKVTLISVAIAAFPPAAAFRLLKFTEFPELAFWGTLSLLILCKITESEKTGWRYFFWYGVVIGIGYYTHPQMIYLAVTGLVCMFFKDKLFFARPHFWPLIPGFLIGAVAVLVDSFYSGWAPFKFFFAQELPQSDFLTRIAEGSMETIRILSAYLGGLYEVYQGNGTVLIPAWILALLLALLATIFIIKFRKTFVKILRLQNVAAGPLAFPLLLLVTIVIFAVSTQSNPPAPYRYIFPVWLAIPVIIAFSLSAFSTRLKLLQGAAPLLIAFLFLWSTIQMDLTRTITQENFLNELIGVLEREEVTAVYANFGYCYNISLATNEKIIGSAAYHWERVVLPRYESEAAADPSPAYFFLKAEGPLEMKFVTKLRHRKARYRTLNMPWGNLYLDINPKTTADQLAE